MHAVLAGTRGGRAVRASLAASAVFVATVGLGTDSAAGEVPPDAVPAVDPCAAAPSSPVDAARGVFEQMVSAWRARLPGPAGEAALVRKVSGLVAEYADFHAFSARAFGRAWTELDEPQRDAWANTLAAVVERRYLDRVGSPLGAKLEVRHATIACPESTLALRLARRKGEKSSDFEVVLKWDGHRWRVVDAIVGEASLLDIYRTRFGRAYRDGGVAAVREHLVQLARRFGAPEPVEPPPSLPPDGEIVAP
jgi:ABC-type transporter MlaC component